MNRATKTLLASATALAFTAGSADADVLYSHTFDGPNTSITGIAPDVVAAGALAATHGVGGTWSNGGGGTRIVDQDGSMAGGSAYLSFSPIDGTVYTLTFTVTHVNNNFVGGGYFDGTGDGSIQQGEIWALTRPLRSSSRQVAFLNGTGTNLGGTEDGTNPSTITITLDTTDGAGLWDADFLVNGVSFATATDIATSITDDIVAVGIGGNADSATSVDSFSLEVVPEPTSLALLGLGGLMIARRRRG